MWFDLDNAGAIGSINLDFTGYVSYPDGGRLNTDIAVGADGYFYVAYVFGANNIGVYNKTGALIANYPLPSVGVTTQSLARGYDNAMWYVEFGGTKIGRVPVGGTPVTTFLPSSPPDSITAGPDNALWFTEPGNGKIGRATTGGITNEFQGPSAGALVRGIASGPDGALWSANLGAGSIGRMTTAGVYSEFPLPSGTGPLRIVAGPDGAMWFTDYNGSTIGRITMSGIATLYPIPSAGAQPTGITVGPDNNIWFTEQATASKIGRITIPNGVTCTLSLGVPIGNDLFTIKTYDAIGGSMGGGNVLSSSSATLAASASGPNTLNFTLNGVVNSVQVLAASSVIAKGTAQTIPISVRALDAANNTIIGPGRYVDQNGNPLTNADGSASTTLSAFTVTSPGAGLASTITAASAPHQRRSRPA